MLSDFVGDVETLNLQIMFIVPGAVLNELDGSVTLFLLMRLRK